MDAETQERIARLVREGKPIADVWREDFPELEYDDVYWAAYGRGARSAQGAKRMITSRLQTVKRTRGRERRADILDEVDELVSALYENHKRMARKLRSIRTALDG